MEEAKKVEAGSWGLFVLRLGVGGMMLTHGLPKFQLLLDEPSRFLDPIGLGAELSLFLVVFAELVCAALIVVGAFTRLACIPLLFAMLVAAFIYHADDPFKGRELALLYGAGTLAILLLGAGRLSVDGWRQGRQSASED
jgi:putative oxidoreductase